MIHLFPKMRGASVLSRRQIVKMSALAAGSFAPWWQRQLSAAPVAPRRAPAKHCIYIFLCGGPSQPDLWDMKPDAPSGIRSQFQPIQTSIPGLQFGELLPQVSRHADKLALIRSMTHSNNDHPAATAHTLLGQLPAVAGQLFVARDDHPGLGAILQKTLEAKSRLPAWVVLPRYFGTNSPPYKGQSGGFLGQRYDPLFFDKERKGSLSDAPLRLGAIELADGISPERLTGRQQLRHAIGQQFDETVPPQAETLYEQAFDLLTAPQTRSTFDLEREPAKLRDRYGRNEYGQSLLMARRLVEAGVRFVNVFWTFFDSSGCQFNLWDNHGVATNVCGIDGQMTGRQQLTHRYCTPSFDQSFSALLEDLSARGLLDETLVAVAGEFGRTPRINKYDGRDHWAHCYTQLLAGGGVRGGSVWGASDAQGAHVKDSPVSPDDFAATILHAFGVDIDTMIADRSGRPIRVTSGRPVTALF